MENWTKIRCGNDEFGIDEVMFAMVDDQNAPRYSSYKINSEKEKLKRDLENVLNKYWAEITPHLKKPHMDYCPQKKSEFSIGTIDHYGEAEVSWEYWYDTNNPGGIVLGQGVYILSLKEDLLPTIKRILKPQKKEEDQPRGILSILRDILSPTKTIYHDDVTETPPEMRKELATVYEEYMSNGKTKDKKLIIMLQTSNGHIRGSVEYVQDKCGFDIFEKEKEINDKLLAYEKKIAKIKNTDNRGEKDVEYIIKWFVASNDGKHILAIKGDCESKYRYDCILLRNSEFIDESQEFDHILVTPAGIIIVETKDWKGTIDVNVDGKWVRYKDDDGSPYGVSSPIIQMRRHEQLMKSIFPNVPIYSILCFSNSSAIINGKDNISECKVINIEQLEDVLNSICKKKKYSEQEIDNIVDTIESYKINRR